MLGLIDRVSPVSRAAAKRRDTFTTREEASRQWGSRPLFQALDRRCFDLYVEHGLRHDPPSNRYTLTIPKRVEQAIFSSVQTRDPTPQECQLKGVYLYSAAHTTTTEACIRDNMSFFKNFKFVKVDGGHLFPLESPEKSAELVADLIKEKISIKVE
jgi:hypothetical protein